MKVFGNYAVINSETKLSMKHFEKKEDAEDYVKVLIDYHKEQFEVKTI